MTKVKTHKPETIGPRENARPFGDLLTKLQKQPYHLEEMTPEKEQALVELKKWFEERQGLKFEPTVPEVSVFPEGYFSDKKKAYPNYEQYQHIPGQHNTQRWLQAVRDIFKREQDGQGVEQSVHQATSNWNVMETYDFLNWLKFYQGGNHLKYKQAQHAWYENGEPGYFLPITKDKQVSLEPEVTGNDIDFAKDEAVMSKEKRDLIEKQRNKIIGRLDSAEKLLRSPDGQSFAGPEFEALMESIYQLKKKIHLVNKISSSIRLYEDMIVREANILTRQGFMQAADVLYKTSQANNPPPAGIGTNKDTPPTATPPDSPLTPLSPGAPGGLPSMGPGMPQKGVDGAPESGPNENSPTTLQGDPNQPNTPAASSATPMLENPVEGFLENLGDGKDADKTKAEDDLLEINDSIDVQDVEDELLVTEAQIVPPIEEPLTTDPAPAPLNPGPPAPRLPDAPEVSVAEEPLEVTEDDIAPPTTTKTPISDSSGFDAKVDAAFANVTIADVVAKLEKISKTYKTREHPRDLSFVDMMLDSLGIVSFFPSLSEAINKSLEANNYISTRVDDILSKLRGTMDTKIVDVKNKLQEDDDKEKARKQQRKEQEAQDLDGGDKEKPDVEIAEDLAPPPAPPPVPRPLG